MRQQPETVSLKRRLETGAFCVFWGTLFAFSTSANPVNEIPERIRKTEQALIESSDQASLQRRCSDVDTLGDRLSQLSPSSPASEGGLGVAQFFALARSVIRMEVRCRRLGDAFRHFTSFQMNLRWDEALPIWDEIRETEIKGISEGDLVRLTFLDTEWPDVFLRGLAIYPSSESFETSLQILAQKKWVESLLALRRYADRVNPEGIPERWKPYFNRAAKDASLNEVDSQYLIFMNGVIAANPELEQLFTPEELTAFLDANKMDSSPTAVQSLVALQKDRFRRPEVRKDVLDKWPTALLDASADGKDLVLMIAQMHKYAWVDVLVESFDLNNEERLEVIKSDGFKAPMKRFTEANVAPRAILRERLNDALRIGPDQNKTASLASALSAFAQAAWGMDPGQYDRPVHFYALDLAFRDVTDPAQLRPEYKDLLPEIESQITVILDLPQSATWIEIQSKYREGLQLFALEEPGRDALSRARSERLKKSNAQWIAIGKLMGWDRDLRPDLKDLRLKPDELKKYEKYSLEMSKASGALFDAIPSNRRDSVVQAFSQYFTNIHQIDKEAEAEQLPLRKRLAELNQKDRKPEEAAAAQKETAEVNAKFDAIKAKADKDKLSKIDAIRGSFIEALGGVEKNILEQIQKFDQPVHSAELEPLLFSEYVQAYLGIPELQGLQVFLNQRQQKFDDPKFLETFYDGMIHKYFTAPIYMCFVPNIILNIMRGAAKEAGKEVIKKTILRRLGAAVATVVRTGARASHSIFHSLYHPRSLAIAMALIINKDKLLFGLEITGLNTLLPNGLPDNLPFNIGPSVWFQHYAQYFGASMGNDGLITAKERRAKTHQFNEERWAMWVNMFYIYGYQWTGTLAGRFGGGWSRLDYKLTARLARRIGLRGAIRATFGGNKRAEADVATAWRDIGGRPEEFSWDRDRINGRANDAFRQAKTALERARIREAQERIIYELDVSMRRWATIQEEYRVDMVNLGVSRFDPVEFRERMEQWEKAYQEGRVGFLEYQIAHSSHQSLMQVMQDAISVRRRHPYMNLLLKTSLNPYRKPPRLDEKWDGEPVVEGGSKAVELLGGDKRLARLRGDSSREELEVTGRTVMPFTENNVDVFEGQIRRWQDQFPNLKVTRDDANHQFVVEYDLRNQSDTRVNNEALAEKIGLSDPNMGALSRAWGAARRVRHFFRSFRVAEANTFEERMNHALAEVGLGVRSGRSWEAVLDEDMIRAAASAVSEQARTARDRAALQRIEDSKNYLISTLTDIQVNWAPIIRNAPGGPASFQLGTLSTRSPFYDAMMRYAVNLPRLVVRSE